MDPFTFEELCILNEDMKTANKELFLHKLKELKQYSEEEEIKQILNNLSVKIEKLSYSDIRELFKMLPIDEAGYIINKNCRR